MPISKSCHQPRLAANDGPEGQFPLPDLHLVTLVDLLAEAFVAKIAANDNIAPRLEG